MMTQKRRSRSGRYGPGLTSQRAMLLTLYASERDSTEAPSLRETGEASGKSWRQARRHLYAMRDAGLIHWDNRLGRDGAQVTLTECGRLAAAMILHPP